MTPSSSRLSQFLDALQSHALTHEVLALCMGATAVVLWLTCWYVGRSSSMTPARWTPFSTDLGWATANLMFWLGVLFGILSLLQFFSDIPVPLWAIVLLTIIAASALFFFRAMAREERR